MPRFSTLTGQHPETLRERFSWSTSLLLVAGAIAAVLNLLAAGRVAVFGSARYSPSIDFQWSPARLLLQHIDPWHVQLSGNPGGAIILGQQPNYLHFIYLGFAPFGALSFAHARTLWLAANGLFTTFAFLRVARYFELSRLQRAVAALLLGNSVALYTAISNGQQTLLVFLFIALALCRPTPPNALWTGLAYFKYSFAPPLFFLLLIRKGLRAIAVSLLPAALGFVLVRLWLPTPTLALLLEPLRVSALVVGDGYQDLMTLLLVLHLPGAVAYALPLLVCGLLTWALARRGSGFSNQAIAAALVPLSSLLFKHLGYDNVLMIFPLAYALRHRHARASTVVLGIVLYFWFAVRVLHRFLPTVSDHLLVPNFLLACILLAATLAVESPHPDA